MQAPQALPYEQIIEGNIELHREEAKFYDYIHQEIWNNQEQKRLWQMLKLSVSQVDENKFRALDFGSGTGNVTGKLLTLGFEVTAIDLSFEMTEILKLKYAKDVESGKLHILNLNIDKVEIEGNFDFITCFSVLHHLPNCLGTIKKLASLIKKGGIFYFDHEPAPLFTQRNSHHILSQIVKYAHTSTRHLLNHLYFWDVDIPKLDYSKADVHAYHGGLDYKCIINELRKEGFSIIEFHHYYSAKSWFRVPTEPFQKIVNGQPDKTLLIAKKQVSSSTIQ